MKIEHLQYFNEVAHCGSINKAAGKLQLSQPYLSAIIKDVERDLGVQLLERHPRGISLTPAGAEALAALAELDAAYAQLQNLRHTYGQPQREPLVFANIYSFTLLDLFNDFSQTNNCGELLTYVEGPPTDMIARVAQGQAGLGMMIYGTAQEQEFMRAVDQAGLVFTPLLREPFYLIISKNHPLAAADSLTSEQMRDYTFVVDKTKRDFHRSNFPHWFKRGKVSSVIFDNSRSAMYYLTKVEHCFSVGQKSLNLTNPFVTSGELRYIPWRDTPYALHTGYLTRRAQRPSQLEQDFCRMLERFFADYQQRENTSLSKVDFRSFVVD